MNPRTVLNMLNAGFVIIVILIQSACSTSTPQVLPTDTVIPNTPTLADTPTTTNTATPDATLTLTPTETITPTFTPNVTATLLPEITPAVEGKGNVAGLVLWNSQPVPQAAVWLCEEFKEKCVGTYQYKTNTDKNGYYVFKNVTPGEYLVAINSFSTGWFMFYFDSAGSKMQKVSAGKDLILDPWNIWKIDLHTVEPRDWKVMSEVHPTFSWDPYPDAAYYLFSIYERDRARNDLNDVLIDKRVDGTEFILEEIALKTCSYYWMVEAYNANGILIAQSKSLRSTLIYLINADVPGTC